MMAKRYKLVEDEGNPFDLFIYITLALIAVMAVVYAAILALPFILAIAVGLWAYRAYNNSPRVQLNREMAELRELHRAIGAKAAAVNVPDPEQFFELVIRRVDEVRANDGGSEVPEYLFDKIKQGTTATLEMSGLVAPPAFDKPALRANVDARNALRAKLYELDDIYRSGDAGVDEVFWYCCKCVGHTCDRLPQGDGIGDEPNDYDFTVELIDVLRDPKGLAEILLFAPFGDQEDDPATLRPLQKLSLSRMAAASGRRVQDLLENPHKVPHPAEDKGTGREVIDRYLGGWPFLPMLWGQVAYRIPPEARFEHMHILGGTGHGKTQLLQRFIREDLTEIYFNHKYPETDDPKRSLVVIDSQGDLIRNIARRKFLAPDDVLADHLLVIDPTDVGYPPALNMFDLDVESLQAMRPADREMIYNGTIELYVYLFGALLDAEMTTRQATLFRYVAQLLLAIPGATLDTLRDILEDGETYQPYIDRLDFSAREFFRTQFFGGELDETKKQVLWRLWSILSNRALANMFNSPVNKIDLFAELQRGTVVLINTSKDFLKTDGSKIFGRFWIAMLAQAALKRAAVSRHHRTDTHVYIDEAHEVIDEKVEEILNQARKYRIGLTLAHQNLQQLSADTRATIAASTSIKMLGGVSEADARAYAGDLRTDAKRIMATKKRSSGAEFATFVKNHMDEALTLNVGFGTLERMDTHDQYAEQRARFRERYCRSEADVVAQQTAENKEPPRSGKNDGDFELGDHEPL